MDTYILLIRRLSQLTGVIAALLIALAVLVICDMVIERYVFNLTTIWQIDVVTYSIVAATFVGSPYVLLHRGHVNVDILPMHSSPRTRYWLAMITGGISVAFCIALLYLGAKFWYEAYSENWRSNTVWRARLWIPYASMPIGLSLLVLQYFAELLATATGRQQPFGLTPDEEPS